jgi:hypothetical protein
MPAGRRLRVNLQAGAGGDISRDQIPKTRQLALPEV